MERKFLFSLLFLSLFSFFNLSSSSDQASLREVNLQEPIIHFIPQSCERIQISPLSRLNLKSYSDAFRVSLNVSKSVPERLHWKIEVCFHRNASMGLCGCETENWQSLHNAQWNAATSPFEKRYIDIKLKDQISTSFSLSISKEFQQWRLICLGIGLILLVLAPIVSDWAPFYYSSSMALGVLLVILLLLFQGMKLLPMGRKNIFYLTIYGSVIGIGSYIAQYFSTFVNTILQSLGLSEEMHNPVSVFLIVGIVLAGAGLGFWVVRKFIISENGKVDSGIAQFVRWAMRIISLFFILQSSLDPLLGLGGLSACWCISYFISAQFLSPKTLRKGGSAKPFGRQPEFIAKPSGNNFVEPTWQSPNSSPYNWSGLPKKGQVTPTAFKKKPAKKQDKDYYSTFHNMPRKKFTKREWDQFTQDSTSKALAQLAASSEFARWTAENAHRVHVDRESCSEEESVESSSDSSEEIENVSNGLGLLRWR
ncbi:hypothetical protein LUZ60_005401 [Juncus effusus]|nr:hypothetical protein LUZ60_005401 [Juncus effusus]